MPRSWAHSELCGEGNEDETEVTMEFNDLEPESVRVAMDEAWRDHHHARDQTWRALQIEGLLGAGLITVDAQFQNNLATIAAGVRVFVAATFELLISWHHRKLEIRKIIHVYFCEEYLGLHRDQLIPKYRDELKKRSEDD